MVFLEVPILTFGFWVIVWILTSIKFGGWQCSTCGSSKVSNSAENEKIKNEILKKIEENNTLSKVLEVFNWIFGVLFLIIGFITFINFFELGFKQLILSVMFFITSFLFLPPIRKYAYEKTHIKLNMEEKAGAFSVVFLIGIILFAFF